MITNQHKCFLELVRAGLWGFNDKHNLDDTLFEGVDWEELYLLAEEQSVVGLLAAGLDYLKIQDSHNLKAQECAQRSSARFMCPLKLKLNIIGEALQIEQRNLTMNDFVVRLMEKLRNENVTAILVKGQGVARCYEKPLWRTSGDVDLLLSNDNYNSAKTVLESIADEVAEENKTTKHQAYVIKDFDVELHARMPFGISGRVDKVIDEVIESSLCSHVNVNLNDNGEVWLPRADEHVFLVFTHFLHHFFIEGVGLRQICDWCRMLFTYRKSLNYGLLEQRIHKAGLITEWKVFATLAVDFLGMPIEAMPMYNENDNEDEKLKQKAEKVLMRVIKSGNFGHNKDLTYRTKYRGVKYKIVATWRRFTDFASLVPVFPMDAPSFFFTYVFNKVK